MHQGSQLGKFTIQQASLADVRSIVRIQVRAWEKDVMSAWIFRWPELGTKDREIDDERQEKEWLPTYSRELVSPSRYAFVVKDRETGLDAGASLWYAPSALKRLHHPVSLHERIVGLCYKFYDTLIKPVIPLAIWSYFFPTARGLYDRRMLIRKHVKLFQAYLTDSEKEKGYWLLGMLGIHPSFVGKGLGQKLLEWGMQKADEDDLPIYMNATPAGSRLYTKNGFVILHHDTYFADDNGGFESLVLRRSTLSERKNASAKTA